MDALSEVLRLARFSAGVTLDATARAPWCVSIPASASMARAHVVIDGKCVVKTAGGEAGELKSSCERHLAEPLVSSLPPVMRVDLNNAAALYWLTDALGLTLSASAAPPVGASAERARLAELVLIEALSRHVYWHPPGGKGW